MILLFFKDADVQEMYREELKTQGTDVLSPLEPGYLQEGFQLETLVFLTENLPASTRFLTIT